MLGEHVPAGCKGAIEGRPGLLEVNYTQISLGVLPGHFKCMKVQTEVLPISLGICSPVQGSEEGIRFCQSTGVSFVLVHPCGSSWIRCPGVAACYRAQQPCILGTRRGVDCCFIFYEWVSRVFLHRCEESDPRSISQDRE